MTNNHENTSNHGNLKSYITGFILSILLTIIPYVLVVNHVLTSDGTFISIVILAVLQLLVQLIFFLHLSSNPEPEQRSKSLSFIFTLVVLFILVAGTLWIMYNMNVNMMSMDH